ncbi:MAG TPA: KTSC domain-containing protein [Sphingobacteriaceae bacterium]
MKRASVSSSVFESIGYDLSRQILEVQFKENGKPVCQYTNIPMRVFRALMFTASKGSYFLQKIKGRYPEIQVSK